MSITTSCTYSKAKKRENDSHSSSTRRHSFSLLSFLVNKANSDLIFHFHFHFTPSSSFSYPQKRHRFRYRRTEKCFRLFLIYNTSSLVMRWFLLPLFSGISCFFPLFLYKNSTDFLFNIYFCSVGHSVFCVPVKLYYLICSN